VWRDCLETAAYGLGAGFAGAFIAWFAGRGQVEAHAVKLIRAVLDVYDRTHGCEGTDDEQG
jgi:hypothetical protein